MKKKLLMGTGILLSIGMGFAHADYQYDNLWTMNLEGGYGETLTPSTNMNTAGGSHSTKGLMYSTGLGYSWAFQKGLFGGVEADYLNNGIVQYKGSGGSSDTGTLNINGSAYAALINITYFVGENWNWFVKVGYAYVQNVNDYSGPLSVDGSGGNRYTMSNDYSIHAWQPMGVFGVGYAFALSDGTGLNLYSDITWINGHSESNFGYINANNDESNQTAEVLAAKVGLQLFF